MSMHEFKWNVFGNIRPSKVKTTISDDVDNPYLGKFIRRRARKPTGFSPWDEGEPT